MILFNDKISLRQLQILLILDMLGIGVIVLPRKVAEYSGHDGWIGIFISMIVIMIFASIMCKLAEMFPTKSFVEYSSMIISKPLGILVSTGFMIRIIFFIGLELRFFGEIVNQTMLNNTPIWIVITCMILISGYCASKGIEARARTAEILILISMFTISIVLVISCFDVDFSNLLPFFSTKPENLLVGSYHTMYSFTGIEFVMLIFPYLSNTRKAGRRVGGAVFIVGLFMVFITMITIARFGNILSYQMWPVLEMADTINIPGALIERTGVLVMSFWIISVFMITNAGLFYCSLLSKDITGKGSHSIHLMIIIPIVLLIALLPEGIDGVNNLLNLLNNTLGLAYLFFVPLVLYIIARIRRLDKK